MDTRASGILTIVTELCKDEGDALSLGAALQRAIEPMVNDLSTQVEDLSTVAYWAEIASYRREKAVGAEKILWRAIEGVLVGTAKVLDKSVMATMHHNNMAERQYHNSGR